jgi:hypothetical protein
MDSDRAVRAILPDSKQFKKFWKQKGPFRYALTSMDFPPVLLEPEEWIFADEIIPLLKALMLFEENRMRIVHAPFNPSNKEILRPEILCPWKITHFPEQWNIFASDIFVPEGHLTRLVSENTGKPPGDINARDMEKSFFQCLETRLDQLGYHLFRPSGSRKYAQIKSYLDEWEKDEKEAGLA